MDSETGVPIVLLHGMRISHTVWRPLAAALATDRRGRPRSVITPDLPGHGRLGDDPFTLDGAVAITSNSMLEPALLVGHSLGGYVAFAAAARHPDRVRGVIAIGSSGRPSPLGNLSYRTYTSLLARNPAVATRLADSAAERMLPPDVFDAWVAGGYTHEHLPEVAAAISGHDPLADVAGYPGPSWMLNGSLDQFRFDEDEFLRAAADGRLTVWPGYNHVSILGATARLATFIEDACAVLRDS